MSSLFSYLSNFKTVSDSLKLEMFLQVDDFFQEQQQKDAAPALEMGNEKPIELESEQCRRRMQKQRASIAGFTRFHTHRGSIAVISADATSFGSSSTKP